MSTPTPRTIKTWSALFVGENDALISKAGHDWRSHPDHYERTSLVKEEDYRTLETELTAALARIAELEETQAICHCGQRLIDHGWQDGHGGTPNNELCPYAEQIIEYREKVDSLTRQLSAANATIERLGNVLTEHRNVIAERDVQLAESQAQLESANRNYEEEKQIVSRIWKIFGNPTYAELKGRSIYDLITELQAQLAEASHVCHCRASTISSLEAQLTSAREDSARLEAVIGGGWSIRHKLGTEQAEGDSLWSVNGSGFFTDLRSAIDFTRGVTSPPAVAETGEKDAWQPIETAPKDGTRILVIANLFNEAKQGTFQEVAVWDSEEDCWARGTDGELEEIHPPTHWQPLPPPPQGKEQE